MIEIVEPGPLATVQDDGRIGRAHQGIARSGAADQGSRALANRLVGNAPTAAVLEVAIGPVVLVALVDTVLAICGASADVRIHSGAATHDAAQNAAFTVRAGSRVRVGRGRDGLRTYIAVRGGVDVPPVLGSRSYDTLGHIGPTPLRPGDLLSIGRDAQGPPWFEVVPVAPLTLPASIDVHPGPRSDWLIAAELTRFLTTTWTVSNLSDRTGVRLHGAELERRPEEIPTEAMIPGAVQLPMDGHPIILGPDCGTTGGYPVIAVVSNRGVDRVGQLRPGDPVRFHAINA